MQLGKVFGEYFIELGYNCIADCKDDETLSFFFSELRSGESKESGKSLFPSLKLSPRIMFHQIVVAAEKQRLALQSEERRAA